MGGYQPGAYSTNQSSTALKTSNSSWDLIFIAGKEFTSHGVILLSFFFSFLGLSLHFWFRDLLRELAKKYEILLMVLFLVFLLFIASEALLFVSFFWASFHSLSSPTLGTWP